MDGKSLSPHIDKLNQLKQILPEAFTEDKIDWEKLRIALGEDINLANERYVLNWAGKSDAFRIMQQPSTQTLVPVRDDSVNFDDTKNVFIEGENLEVLKVLQKSYFGKVKMIYIDPPYNTGNDSFIYPDRFAETKEEYQKRVGDKDEEGYMTGEGMFRKNSRENGQYHSNWLNMMMPRLYLARTLLRDDGVIFVSIDDNEVHNLRLLMNEIFGEENFVANFLWKKKGTTSNVVGAQVSSLTDSTLCYRKTEKGLIKPRIVLKDTRNYPFTDIIGNYRTTVIEKKDSGSYKRESMKYEIMGHLPRKGKRWQIGIDTAKELEEKNRFLWDGEKIKLKIYNFEDKDTLSARPNLLFDNGTTDSAANEVFELFGIEELFDNPKPTELIKELLQIIVEKDDLILDFFAGSATTAHAVMQLNKEDGGNRKYILVQLPELCDEKSEAYKAGYRTIADIAKERIRRAGKKIQDEIAEENKKKKEKLDFEENAENSKLDTGFKVFKLSESNFKQWQQPENYSAEALSEQLKLFIDPVAENANLQNMVYELLLKSGKDLNVSIEQRNGYYLIEGNRLAFILEKVNEQIIADVLAKQPKKVIALDRIFKNNDQLKTNTALQMKDAGVEFKTI
ncbi:MAG TPA: site-specific DNA-methyltransferase [Acholeplasmataceae bacterium]|jgi:adenine-specific DNA-methyltransferase|nr:site-specific DNA-methyltransferase [Acholeplasmataceae bacterium]